LRKTKAIKEIQTRWGDMIEHQQRREKHHETAMKQLEEDWALGPLAPRRESGVEAMRYGFADFTMAYTPPALPQSIKTQKAQWRNGFLRNRFVKGDRVVIIKGLGQGIISTVRGVNHDQLTVSLGDEHRVCPNGAYTGARIGVDSYSLGPYNTPRCHCQRTGRLGSRARNGSTPGPPSFHERYTPRAADRRPGCYRRSNIDT
jgi:preprotein translocase subunit YajC